jgi:hypothetical protein
VAALPGAELAPAPPVSFSTHINPAFREGGMNRSTLIIPLAALAAILSGCATSPHGNLPRSAERLDHNAEVLARDEHAGSSYSREATEFADRAHDFRRAVEDSRTDRRDLDDSFASLSRSYHELRDDVDRADSREAQLDLKPVTEAYLDVEREMGGARANDRYARDRDYDHDHYAR